MGIFSPTLACDYYKIGHALMQPEGFRTVYSTWTARSAKHHPGCPKTVVFGHQYVIRHHIHEFFRREFFNIPVEILREEYERTISSSFHPAYASFDRFAALHALGYLPLEFRGVPEGTLLPTGVPELVFFNTHPDFAWLPQFIEDMWSANAWLPSTSATTAHYRKELLRPFVEMSCDDIAVLDHMCGDFSLREHTSLDAGYVSGAGHLVSFDRTATIHANTLLAEHYGMDGPAGLGVPSLEHSVVEQGVALYEALLADGREPEWMRPYVAKADSTWEPKLVAEMCFILHLLNDVQPKGVMTYVSDTYDYWGVVSKVLPAVADAVLAREGCFSVRPDSGNPVDIVCGTGGPNSEGRGTMEILLDTFGWTRNGKGFKVLPPQVRLIYGDAVTSEVSEAICRRLVERKVSVENVVFGIGAYTYQYVTRDTRGYAVKATWAEHGELGPMPLYKAPKTAPWKRSVKGCVAVLEIEPGVFVAKDGLNLRESLEHPGNVMRLKYRDGEFHNLDSFPEVRARLAAYGAMEDR